MRRLLKWLASGLCVLLVLAAGLWTWSRMQPLTPAQREAMALLQPRPAPAGRNAFAAVWLLRYDVPAARMEAVTDEDMARLRALVAEMPESVARLQAYRSVAADRYADLQPAAADADLFCGIREDCLQRVRTDPVAYAALVARNRRLLERVAALRGDDFLRDRRPADFSVPMLEHNLLGTGITQAAQAYAMGDIDAGVARACEGVATWRRLGARSDTLILRMQGIGLATDGYGRLLAQMLAELPADHALPRACDGARAPPAVEELSVCDALRKEHAVGSEIMRGILDSKGVGKIDRVLGSIVYDPARTEALTAESRTLACTEHTRQLLEADAKVSPTPSPQRSYWRMECLANLSGCMMATISSGADADYVRRAQDAGARLDLLRGVVSLRDARAGNAAEREAALRRFWATTRSHARELRFVDGGAAVEVRQFDQRRGGWWRLPLATPEKTSAQGMPAAPAP
jgi:hypothetical protein